MTTIGRLALAGTMTLLVATTARAQVTVENCSDDSAFDSALIGGGTITFDCGGQGNAATIVLRSTKTIGAATTIDGGGKVTLSGANALRLFSVNAGASLDLRNIVLEDGFSKSNGGAIYNAGFLALEDVTILSSGTLNGGGAIFTTGSSDITDAIFGENVATNGGAVMASGPAARVSISGSVFFGNQSQASSAPDGRGGAIFANAGAQMSVYSSDLHENTASDGGA